MHKKAKCWNVASLLRFTTLSLSSSHRDIHDARSALRLLRHIEVSECTNSSPFQLATLFDHALHIFETKSPHGKNGLPKSNGALMESMWCRDRSALQSSLLVPSLLIGVVVPAWFEGEVEREIGTTSLTIRRPR